MRGAGFGSAAGVPLEAGGRNRLAHPADVRVIEFGDQFAGPDLSNLIFDRQAR